MGNQVKHYFYILLYDFEIMEKYKQVSKKISAINIDDLYAQINLLGAVGDMDVNITTTTPNATDTNYWYLVNYWVRII